MLIADFEVFSNFYNVLRRFLLLFASGLILKTLGFVWQWQVWQKLFDHLNTVILSYILLGSPFP